MLRKFQNVKSPKIAKMMDLFKQQNKNSNNKKKYNTKTLNPKQLNNKKNRIYNTKTVSPGNMSNLTQSQMLDYSLINNEIKRKKNRGVLDVTSHRNKNIFIETDSEQYNSRKNSQDSLKTKRKRCCSKLIVDKVTSHKPDTLSREKEIIKNNNNSNNQNVPNNLNDLYEPYSIKTYNNNFNINDINNLYDFYNSDGYEFEKSETIKIKKINFIPNGQNGQNRPNIDNNRIEKRIIIQNIKNNRNPDNNINKYNFNTNDNLEENLNKEKDLQKAKRTNNLSYISSDLRPPKYPFVIKTKGQDAPSPYDLYYRTIKNPNIKNYKTNYNNIYKESQNDLDNNYNYYIPLNERNLTETSDNPVSPEKQNNFIFHKKRIYENNDINDDNNIDNNYNDNFNDYQPKNIKLSNMISN